MARAMSACAIAGDGITISSAPRTASPMSAVARAIGTSRAPRASFSTIEPASITGAERRGVAPPEAHFMAGFGQVGGGGVAAMAAAQDRDLHVTVLPCRTAWSTHYFHVSGSQPGWR